MPKTKPLFLFAIREFTPDEQIHIGMPYDVIITDKTFYDTYGGMQDAHDSNTETEFKQICEKYGLIEDMEFHYECHIHDAGALRNLLNAEPLMEFSPSLQQFFDNQ